MKQNRIVCPRGVLSPIQRKAVEMLTRTIVNDTINYPGVISCTEYVPDPEIRDFFIGTKDNNFCIRERSKAVLTKPEEYAICVENDTVVIEGFDDAGVLYGCVDFYPRYVANKSRTFSAGPYLCNVFESAFADFSLQSAPAVKNRGLWTWGHVIYDYKGYIDNMLKLKMNTVIIWNEYAPLNADEMVAYAHAAGIKVIWGFAWLWSTDCNNVDFDRLDEAGNEIVDYYEKNYAHMGGDGIYFQSFTELNKETIGGVLIADAVSRFVNDTAAKFFAKYGDIEIQFGLHTESVRNRLEFIGTVDPRVRIVWENCGCFPFSYIPEAMESFPATMQFVDQISTLRGDEERFGVVLKGLTKLDWAIFEHQTGPFYLGTAGKELCENRIARKRRIWHYVQAGWLMNADKVRDIVELMRKNTDGDLYITALVEDGMFDRKLYYPVALLGEFLWDAETELSEVIHRVALREDVEFV